MEQVVLSSAYRQMAAFVNIQILYVFTMMWVWQLAVPNGTYTIYINL